VLLPLLIDGNVVLNELDTIIDHLILKSELNIKLNGYFRKVFMIYSIYDCQKYVESQKSTQYTQYFINNVLESKLK